MIQQKRAWLFLVLISVCIWFFTGCRSEGNVVKENINAAPWLQFLGRNFWIVFLVWLLIDFLFIKATFPKQLPANQMKYNEYFFNGNLRGRLLFIAATLFNVFCFVVLIMAVNDKRIFSGFIISAIGTIGLITIVITSLIAIWKFIFVPQTVIEDVGREEKLFTTVVHYKSYSISKQDAVEKGYKYFVISIFASQIINFIALFKTLF